MAIEMKKPAVGPLGIPGNLPAQTRLLNYLRGGRIHPAVILAGPAGSGKLSMAKNIARFIFCQKKTPASAFCGKCSPCLRIEKEVHPDVLICREESEDIIKIDTVRDFCHQMEISPMEGRAKVCIVDECHRLNPAAANAFLKTLEEPGVDRYFWLLTSQPGNLLPTLLSRCLKFSLVPLTDVSALPGVADLDFDKIWQEFVTTKNAASVTGELTTKEKAHAFVVRLMDHLRGATIAPFAKVPGGSPFGASSEYRRLIQFEAALQLEGRLRSNANYGLMLESFLIKNFIDESRDQL